MHRSIGAGCATGIFGTAGAATNARVGPGIVIVSIDVGNVAPIDGIENKGIGGAGDIGNGVGIAFVT